MGALGLYAVFYQTARACMLGNDPCPVDGEPCQQTRNLYFKLPESNTSSHLAGVDMIVNVYPLRFSHMNG